MARIASSNNDGLFNWLALRDLLRIGRWSRGARPLNDSDLDMIKLMRPQLARCLLHTVFCQAL